VLLCTTTLVLVLLQLFLSLASTLFDTPTNAIRLVQLLPPTSSFLLITQHAKEQCDIRYIMRHLVQILQILEGKKEWAKNLRDRRR